MLVAQRHLEAPCLTCSGAHQDTQLSCPVSHMSSLLLQCITCVIMPARCSAMPGIAPPHNHRHTRPQPCWHPSGVPLGPFVIMPAWHTGAPSQNPISILYMDMIQSIHIMAICLRPSNRISARCRLSKTRTDSLGVPGGLSQHDGALRDVDAQLVVKGVAPDGLHRLPADGGKG